MSPVITITGGEPAVLFIYFCFYAVIKFFRDFQVISYVFSYMFSSSFFKMIFYLKTQWWVNWCLSITPSTFIFHRKTPRDYSSSSISISIFSTFHQGSRHKIPTWTSSYVSVSTGQPWERGWGSLFLTPTWLLGVSLAYADLSEFVLKVLHLSSKNVTALVPKISHCICS